MIKSYSVKRQGSLELAGGLRVAQFACGDGSDEVLIDDGLVEVLAAVSAALGRAPCIVSGYRTPRYNRICGGGKDSQHTHGRAADVRFGGVEPFAAAVAAESIMPEGGGIGYHVNGHVHIDVRAERTRWRQDGMGGRAVTVEGFFAPPPAKREEPVLRRGDAGEAVRLAQGVLAIKQDGVYGELTEAAVCAFQALYGLEATGAIDKKTFKALGLRRAVRTAEGRVTI